MKFLGVLTLLMASATGQDDLECEDDIDYNEGTVFFRHSLDRWSNFRANFLKTRTFGLAPSNTVLTVNYTYGGSTEDNVLSNEIINKREISNQWKG